MRADRRDPVIAKLRKLKPTKFEVTLRDGAKKSLPLSSKGNRWELLLETLDALQWVAIEAQDAEGQTLGAIEREGEWEDELDPDIVRGEGLARIIASVVSSTMAECRKMYGDTMKSQSEMVRSMLDSQQVVQENYQLALRMQGMALTSGQTPEEPDKLMDMFKMAMMLRGTPVAQVPQSPAKPSVKPTANGASK